MVALIVIFLLVIHITASIAWLTNFQVNNAIYAVVTSIIIVNLVLITGLLMHKKGIIIVWLWFHGILLVTGAVLDYPSVPVSMIVITASCFLAVYVLLQTFDHHIRIEVRYNNNRLRNQEAGHGSGLGNASNEANGIC